MQHWGFFEHVTKDHLFEAKYLFFRFNVDNLQTSPLYDALSSSLTGLVYLGHVTPCAYELAGPSTRRRPTGLSPQALQRKMSSLQIKHQQSL